MRCRVCPLLEMIINREGLYDRYDAVGRGGRQVEGPRYTLPIFLIVSASTTMTKTQTMVQLAR